VRIKEGIEDSVKSLEERREALIRRKAPKGVIDSVEKKIKFAKQLLVDKGEQVSEEYHGHD